MSLLLTLARDSIREVFEGSHLIDKEQLLSAHPVLEEKVPCFVSLYINDELRGSAGSIFPQYTLITQLSVNAKRASFEDTRFSPLKTSEYLTMIVAVSLLSDPQEIYVKPLKQTTLMYCILHDKKESIVNFETLQKTPINFLTTKLYEFEQQTEYDSVILKENEE